MTVFSGLKVLIVEDEFAVAMMIEDMLQGLGCEVVSSSARVEQACEIARALDIEAAVLDVNVAGKPVFPVAEILRTRQVPILFSTGYGASGLSSEFSNYPVLSKPFSEPELQRALSIALQAAQ